MSEQKKIPTLSEEDAFYWNERNVLKGMSDADVALARKKFGLSQKALADHLSEAGVKSQTDFDRRVNSMSDAEFSKFKQDLNFEAAKKGSV